MPNTSASTNGLASRVMRRAWAIFRKSYNYPNVPFRSIGRKCFACRTGLPRTVFRFLASSSLGVAVAVKISLGAAKAAHP